MLAGAAPGLSGWVFLPVTITRRGISWDRQSPRGRQAGGAEHAAGGNFFTIQYAGKQFPRP